MMKRAGRLRNQLYKSTLFALMCAVCLFLVTGCAALQEFSTPAGQSPDVSFSGLERITSEGIVVGQEDTANQTLSWKAIPYAAPPVGDLRWMAPKPPQKRSAPLIANKFCEICPQYVDHDRNAATLQVVAGKEDCLYLNIWAPKSAKGDSKLPVFFWIHGGGNSIQWPLLSLLDGGILAGKGNMIVVTMNYRLGYMGFLNHSALKTGNTESDSGNFATLDLIAALKWVQANIGNFGGDAGNVTIVGESAGGQNVYCLISSPLAKNLFSRAIAESAVIRSSAPADGEAQINDILAQMMVKDGKAADLKSAQAKLAAMPGKEVAAYLRSKNPQDFLEYHPEGKENGMIRFPQAFSDGVVLPVDFDKALSTGQYNKVPLITGTNKEEAKLFLRRMDPFKEWIMFQSLYEEPDQMELYDLVAKYQSDAWKVMAVNSPVRRMRANADQPAIYTYQFLWGAGGLKHSVIGTKLGEMLGSCHAIEIDFVFGTEAASMGAYVFNDKNRPGRVALSNAMMDYWAQFARTGNPNREGSGLLPWAPWSNVDGQAKTILLDADLEKAKITMSDKDLTEKDLEAALKAEPRAKEILPLYEASPYR